MTGYTKPIETGWGEVLVYEELDSSNLEAIRLAGRGHRRAP